MPCLSCATSCDLRHGLRPVSRVPKRLTPSRSGAFMWCPIQNVKNRWTTTRFLWITRLNPADNFGYKLCIDLGL